MSSRVGHLPWLELSEKSTPARNARLAAMTIDTKKLKVGQGYEMSIVTPYIWERV